jgi:hypothetical protein
MIMKSISTSERSADFYETTGIIIPEDSHLRTQSPETLMYDILNVLVAI